MTKIITISREFGSGGRELGKRLAEDLGYSYYDKEVVKMIAEKSEMDEGYITSVLDNGNLSTIPVTIGHSFSMPIYFQQGAAEIFITQQEVLEKLAKAGNCVIIGQSADVILDSHEPLKLFVYADMPSKIKRCKERAPQGENMTDAEYKKMIKKIDNKRAKNQELLSDYKWGQKERYDLCINTSGLEIKSLVPGVREYAKCWFGK